MIETLSFATVNMHDNNIVEVIIDGSTEISLEMTEEFDQFLSLHCTGPIGLLFNKLNDYVYSFESKLTVASHTDIRAIAVVYYTDDGQNSATKIQKIRAMDNLNIAMFSGVESGEPSGWQQAMSWLQQQVILVESS
jgi:hypothetical protein